MIEKRLVSCRAHYKYTIYGVIDEFDVYGDFIKDLHKSNKGDLVEIRLNSPGGRVDVGVALLTAIKECEAKIKIVVEYPCYSMGAILALAGNELEIRKRTFLMFHDYSTFMGGKGSELTQQAGAEKPIFDGLLEDVCYPFLTKKEIKSICEGKDMYIQWDAEDLDLRIKRHFK